VRREGKSYAHPLIVLQAVFSGQELTRIGIIASRSIGKATDRNLAKRRIRAAVRPMLTHIKPGWDVIFIARKPVLQAEFQALVSAMDILLKRANLFVEKHA
jgi:ribonuclease P protein component